MNRLLGRLAESTVSRKRLIIAIWALVLLAALPLASRQGEALTNGGYVVPGSGSRTVELALEREFPNLPRNDLAVVLRSERPQPAAAAAEVKRIRTEVEKNDGVTVSTLAAKSAVRQAASSDIVILPIQVTGTYNDANNAAVELYDSLEPGQSTARGFDLYFVGQSAFWAALSKQAREDLQQAEALGLPISLLVLIAVFGSLSAALLPLALGLVAVVLTGAVVYLLSLVGEVSVYVTNAVSMIGIGVAIDYSLFILVRYRQHLLKGESRDAAVQSAVRTSGFAVMVSALTVIVSLAGLFAVNSTVLRSLALGSMIVVSIALLGALTLTPVLIETLGHRGRRFRRKLEQAQREGPAADPTTAASPFWQRWTATVMRRPILMVTLSGGLLLLLAAPALDLKSDEKALAQLPKDNQVRTGLNLAAKVAGRGAIGPVRVLTEFESGQVDDPANAAAWRRYLARVRADPRVASVQAAAVSSDGDTAVATVIARGEPDSSEVTGLVDDLEQMASEPPLGVRANTAVGGTTAQTRDFKNLIAGSLWKVLLLIITSTFLLLAVLLRSILLPLKAVIVTGLTVAASYGVLVVIFQWELFGHAIGYIGVTNLPLILAVTFGLTMDYQVFLLLRIRERYATTRDPERAVAEGLASSAGVITSAAGIMVVVFLTFAFTGVPGVQQIGIGLAAAIALDATLVRLILVPAAMKLFGEWNWWFPDSLAARLPEMPSEFALEAGEAASGTAVAAPATER